jgi:hypothetical protein
MLPTPIPARFAVLVPVLVLAGCAGPASEADSEGGTSPFSLAELLDCHDAAVGGDAVRRIERVEYDLRIQEPSFEVDATYVATRQGTARIDIFADGERVFSEGWDGEVGWQLRQGEVTPEPNSAEGAAALRHGIEQPGHLWTLRDMAGHGHSIREDPADTMDPAVVTDREAATDPGGEADREADADPGLRGVHLTLADGAESWYGLDTASCLVTRTRDFRAFHPDVDPGKTWIETRFADFRETDGVVRAWSTYSIDLATGDTISVIRLVSVRTTFGPS